MSAPGCTRFRTASGSEYLIDHAERVWRRSRGTLAAKIRSENGVYWWCSQIGEGKRVTLICPPIVETAVYRVITSSPVVSVQTGNAEH